jgi:hypothetical protein
LKKIIIIQKEKKINTNQSTTVERVDGCNCLHSNLSIVSKTEEAQISQPGNFIFGYEPKENLPHKCELLYLSVYEMVRGE